VRHAVAIVLTTVAALVLAASASVTYGLAASYGADTPAHGLGAVFLVLLPAGLALLCLVGARDPVGGPRPTTGVLTVGVLVVFAATGAAAAAYGGRVHERERAAQTTACSPDDLALLAAVDAPGAHSEPAGDGDGGCSMVVSWVPDVDLASARVVASLEDGGWQRAAGDGHEQVFEREDAVLHLTASSDGKATQVRLTLAPP
jgi:hypothetical protein